MENKETLRKLISVVMWLLLYIQ